MLIIHGISGRELTHHLSKNISQHLVSASFNATLANSVPIGVTYFERQSNSSVFRDFRDIRIELNTQEFQRLQANKFRSYLTQAIGKFHDPITKPAMDISLKKITEINSWLIIKVSEKN